MYVYIRLSINPSFITFYSFLPGPRFSNNVQDIPIFVCFCTTHFATKIENAATLNSTTSIVVTNADVSTCFYGPSSCVSGMCIDV